MTTYHIEPAWTLLSFGLATPFFVASFWMHDVRVLCFAALLYLMAFINLTSRVAIDHEGASTSFGLFPFLLRWRKSVRWADVVEVRATQNPFFVEADTLHIVARSLSGKQQHIYIPFVLYADRKELLRQIFSLLPSHVAVSPALVKWAETVGITPRWQLAVALGIVLVLAGILWWSSIPH